MCFVDTIDQNLKRKEKKMSLKYFPMLVHLILIASWLVSREESFKLANEVEDPQVMHRLQKFIAATYFRHIESNIWLNNNNIDVVAVAQFNNRLLRANKELAVAKFRRQTGGNYCLFCDLIAVIFSYSKDMQSFPGWKMTNQIFSNVANYLQPWEFLFLVQFCIVFHQ